MTPVGEDENAWIFLSKSVPVHSEILDDVAVSMGYH